MDAAWGIAGGVAAVAAGTAAVLWRPLRRRWWQRELARARQSFHRQREHLEAKFFQLAAESGKPRGLSWSNIDFEDDVTYARTREKGELEALVGVEIRFEAVPGGGMEHVEAVSRIRAATAVFLFHRGQWTTEGRVLFNLNPLEALQYYQADLELVGQETK